MNPRFLVPLAWTMLGISVLGLLYGLFRVSTDRSTSPEAGRGLGVMVVVALLVVVGILGVMLHVAVRRQSSVGITALVIVLGWPLFVLVASPVVRWWKTQSFEREYARVGDFRDPVLASMAAAIVANDTTKLAELLGGKAPPPGVDGAGNDLLAFALVQARDRQGSTAPVRVLLEAGADPRLTKIGETGQDALNFMLLGMNEVGKEIVWMLLDRGVDVNVRDVVSGTSPLAMAIDDIDVVRRLVERGAEIDALQPGGVPVIVSAIAQREWDTALYLIEKGATLDVANSDGLSVDYYLKSWSESVFGDHPEGWDRVRQAISARRGK